MSGDHLLPEVRELLLLSDEARIAAFQSRDYWIDIPSYNAVVEDALTVIKSPIVHRPDSLSVLAETNMGKSRIVRRIRSEVPPREVELIDESLTITPFLAVDAPSNPTDVQLLANMMRALGYPSRLAIHYSKNRLQALELLVKAQVRLISLDNAQRMVSHGSLTQDKTRHLVGEVFDRQIPLLLLGSHGMTDWITADPHFSNRVLFKHVLAAYQPDEDWQSLLGAVEQNTPLKKPSNLQAPDLANEIYNKTDGSIGETRNLVRLAAIKAIRTRTECITANLLNSINWIHPALRMEAS